MKNFKNKKGVAAKFWLIFFCFGVMALSGPLFAANYSGLISVKGGIPLTPSPAPSSMPTNLRFYLNNSSPSPDQAISPQLGTDKVVAEGDASSAIYNIMPFGTITVLVDNGTNYGRTSQGKNINSGLIENMTFVGGAFKAYEMTALNLPYLKEAPIAPSSGISLTLEGYQAGDFKPIAKVTVNNYSDPNHEKSSPAYSYEIYDGKTLLTSSKTDSGSWQPDPAKLADTSSAKTYTIKVYTHNWFGNSKTSTDGSLLVPAPSTGGTLTETTLTLSFSKPSNKTGINTFTIPFVVSKGIKINDSTTAEAALTVGQLINAINAINANKTVTVFGWYDSTSQQHIGFTSIPGGDLSLAVPTGKKFDASGNFVPDSKGNYINYTKDEILTMMVVKNQPHQVSVSSGVTLTLKGFTQ